MGCSCQHNATTSATGAFFSKHTRRYLKSFKRKGLAKEQRYLLEGITSKPLHGNSLLEVGCGVGGLHLTLLGLGASSSVGIDTSEGMIEAARSLARERALDAQAEYLVGDFVARAPEIAVADVTILDKVVCCYENVDELVMTSLKKTRGVYALSFPRSHILVRWFFTVPIIVAKILRWSFRPYWHDWARIVGIVEREGFHETYAKSTAIWSVRIFRKDAGAHG